MLRWMKNIDIFEDTIKQCKTNPKLILAIMRSIRGQRVYLENDNTIASYQPTQNSEKARVIISEKRSFEAAMPYAKAGKRVCVLNFAAWTTPGGGVESGCSAQEESLCRCSTLYPCISSEETFKSFYLPHREMKKQAESYLHNDDIIYTPDVVVFKTDTDFPKSLPEDEWYKVDIITCAAPRLYSDYNEEKLEEVISSRIEKVFKAPLVYNSKNYDVLILGAFGCGAFKNPPELVAKIFNNHLKSFCYNFEVIEFPIFHKSEEDKNFSAFKKYISG